MEIPGKALFTLRQGPDIIRDHGEKTMLTSIYTIWLTYSGFFFPVDFFFFLAVPPNSRFIIRRISTNVGLSPGFRRQHFFITS